MNCTVLTTSEVLPTGTDTRGGLYLRERLEVVRLLLSLGDVPEDRCHEREYYIL